MYTRCRWMDKSNNVASIIHAVHSIIRTKSNARVTENQYCNLIKFLLFSELEFRKIGHILTHVRFRVHFHSSVPIVDSSKSIFNIYRYKICLSHMNKVIVDILAIDSVHFGNKKNEVKNNLQSHLFDFIRLECIKYIYSDQGSNYTPTLRSKLPPLKFVRSFFSSWCRYAHFSIHAQIYCIL